MSKLFLFALMFLSCSAWAQNSQKLFILIGQSNMAGRADIETEDTATLTKVFLLNDKGSFEPARNPLNRYSNIRKQSVPQKLGPGYSFAQAISKELGDTIFLVVNARGGTGIERFIKGDSSQYYAKTIARVREALNSNPRLKVEAIVWHQGESNSNSSQRYIEHFEKLVADYRHDLKAPLLPVIVGQTGVWNPIHDNINRVIESIPTLIPNTLAVSAEGLTNCDKSHFDSASQRELGRRYANRYFELIKK